MSHRTHLALAAAIIALLLAQLAYNTRRLHEYQTALEDWGAAATLQLIERCAY